MMERAILEAVARADLIICRAKAIIAMMVISLPVIAVIGILLRKAVYCQWSGCLKS